MMQSLNCVSVSLCAFTVLSGESVSYLRLKLNSEDVQPSRGVLCLQSHCLELCIYEEQPEDRHTQYIQNKSTSIHREGYT